MLLRKATIPLPRAAPQQNCSTASIYAAQQQNYEGTFVYQRGATVQSSRITHAAARGDGEYESLESLDGKPRRMLRHDDDMFTFVPERHLCVVEKRQNKDSFPALLATSGDQVLSVYEPKMLGTDRVAGLDSQVIELDPKDSYRFAYKLWADAKTGLLLRAQTLDPDGQVLEQLSFSQVRIGGPVDKAAIANGIRNTSGWTIVRPPVQPVDMEAQGWQLTPNIAGFRKIRELRRPMASREEGQPPIPGRSGRVLRRSRRHLDFRRAGGKEFAQGRRGKYRRDARARRSAAGISGLLCLGKCRKPRCSNLLLP